MSGFSLGIILGLIGLAIAGLSIAAARHQLADMNAAWQSAASTLGFSFRPGSMRTGPSMSGAIGGNRATARSYVKSSGKNSTRHTQYSVEFPPAGIGLHLSRQAGIGRLLKVLGAQDIVVGEPVFDETFIVRADDEPAARALLTTGRTMALNQLLALYPEAVVWDDRIEVDRRSTVRKPDVLVSTLRRLASTAELLTDRGEAADLTSLVERRLDGGLTDDAAGLDQPPAGFDARLAAGEVLTEMGVLDAARTVFEALSEELPADPDVEGWSRRSRELTVPDSPGAAPGASDATIATRVNCDAEGVALDLFGDNRLSFETAEAFAATYAGRDVRWSGKLRRVTEVERDRILGDGPFSKAVVDVARLDNDLFGSTVVSAILALPHGSIDESQVGEDVAFTGRLVGIDALVRNVFVGEAALTDS